MYVNTLRNQFLYVRLQISLLTTNFLCFFLQLWVQWREKQTYLKNAGKKWYQLFRQVACSGYQHKHWTSFLCLLWHVLYMLVPALSSGLTSSFGSNDSNTEHQQLPSIPILKPHPLLTTRGIVHITNLMLHHSRGKLKSLRYGKYNSIIL